MIIKYGYEDYAISPGCHTPRYAARTYGIFKMYIHIETCTHTDTYIEVYQKNKSVIARGSGPRWQEDIRGIWFTLCGTNLQPSKMVPRALIYDYKHHIHGDNMNMRLLRVLRARIITNILK